RTTKKLYDYSIFYSKYSTLILKFFKDYLIIMISGYRIGTERSIIHKRITTVKKPNLLNASVKQKPVIVLPKYSGVTDDLKSIVYGSYYKMTLTPEVFITWLMHSSVTKKCKLETDWKSFGLTIGEKDKSVSWLDIVNVVTQDEEPLPKESSVQTTKISDRSLAIMCLSVYRLNSTQNDDHRTRISDNISKFLIDDPNLERVDLSPCTAGFKKWMKNKNFLKLVAALDMFYSRFTEEDEAAVRIGTLGSRYKDQSVWVSLGYFSRITGFTGSKFLDWIWDGMLADQLERICTPGQEDDDDYSYFPYGHDFCYIPVSAYSAVMNPEMHCYIHMVGALLGKKRSINARNMEEVQSQNYITHALTCAYAISQSSDMTAQFSEDGKKPEGKAPPGGGARRACPVGRDGKTWLTWMNNRGNVLSDEMRVWFDKRRETLRDSREGSIGECLRDMTL
ncbi:nucleoprotein, partial [Cuiaba virus]